MKIGIIGSGNVGGTLTRRLRALGHEVTVANSRGPQSLTRLAEETRAEPGTVQGAAQSADVVASRIALPVAGDDDDAKRTVMTLVDELGFDLVDAGTLDESWRQQPESLVYGRSKDAAGVRAGLAAAVRR